MKPGYISMFQIQNGIQQNESILGFQISLHSQKSAEIVLASQFWDSRGVIHFDYLDKVKIITGEY